MLDIKPSALVAHECPAMRRTLRGVLNVRLGLACVIEVDSLDEAIELLAGAHGITLAIISLNLQGVEPCVTVRLLREHFPTLRVVVASSCTDRLDVLRPLAAGAHGHIDIGASAEDLAETLDLIYRGQFAVPSGLPNIRCQHA